MKPPTIDDIVADEVLGLRLLGGHAATRRDIRSVHVSDLPKPGRYLLPGELVLTNGLWLDETPAEDWVHEVAAAGAVGVGFGLGTPHESVPEALVERCDEAGLPLVAVPVDLSFASIADVIAERITQGKEIALRRHLQRTRSLVQALSADGGYDALLQTLRQATGLDASFVGPGGRLLGVSGEAPTADEVSAAERAALHHALPAAVGARATAFGASASSPPSSTLVVGIAFSEIDDETRVVVEQVAGYGALEDARRRSARDAQLAHTQELLDLLADGKLGMEALAARMSSSGLDPGEETLAVAAAVDLPEVRYALDAVGLPYVLAQREGAAIALVTAPKEGDVVALVARAIENTGREAVVGSGRATTGPEGLRRSLAEARHALALSLARAPGTRVVRHVDIGSHVALLELLEPETLAQFRDSVLGAVERWDAEHATDLIGTLRAFLDSGGRWRATAARLHVHDNTLRHRLKRVEALTGRDLGATGDRVDFQLALGLAVDDRPISA